MDALLVGIIANIVAIIAAFGKGISVLISIRDDIRDMKKDIGSREPAIGLLGDVCDLQETASRHELELERLSTYSGLGRRRYDGKHTRD